MHCACAKGSIAYSPPSPTDEGPGRRILTSSAGSGAKCGPSSNCSGQLASMHGPGGATAFRCTGQSCKWSKKLSVCWSRVILGGSRSALRPMAAVGCSMTLARTARAGGAAWHIAEPPPKIGASPNGIARRSDPRYIRIFPAGCRRPLISLNAALRVQGLCCGCRLMVTITASDQLSRLDTADGHPAGWRRRPDGQRPVVMCPRPRFLRRREVRRILGR